WLASRGVAVRLTTGVRSVELDAEGMVSGVSLRSGEAVAADFVVLAVPFDRVAGLLPPAAVARMRSLDRLGEMEASPITGVHLWFDREVCPFEHLAVVGRLVQWVFDHTSLQG